MPSFNSDPSFLTRDARPVTASPSCTVAIFGSGGRRARAAAASRVARDRPGKRRRRSRLLAVQTSG
jgi:hypothetical protein